MRFDRSFPGQGPAAMSTSTKKSRHRSMIGTSIRTRQRTIRNGFRIGPIGPTAGRFPEEVAVEALLQNKKEMFSREAEPRQIYLGPELPHSP